MLTTHSPPVLSELAPEEVFVVRRAADGSVSVNSVPSAVGYVLARAPEAVLSRKVVVAEGATEEGLCQALDEAWTDAANVSFAYRGTTVVDGLGGTQPAEIAGHLHALGYEVALLIDSDATAKASKAADTTVLAWPDGLCTEQRLARDLPVAVIREMAVMAANTARRGQRSVRDAIADGLGLARTAFGDDAAAWVGVVAEGDFRDALGGTAKQEKHGWFKSRDQGRFLGRLIFEHWKQIEKTPTRHRHPPPDERRGRGRAADRAPRRAARAGLQAPDRFDPRAAVRGDPQAAGGRFAAQEAAPALSNRVDFRLATLAACGTGIVGTELLDELVLLPSALLQAGFGPGLRGL